MSASSQSRDPRRGSILIMVVVTLMITAFALTLFIEKASDDLLVDVRDADARHLRAEAYSAMETTLCVLSEFARVNGSLRSPSEGWGEALVWADYEPAKGRSIELSFEDESGKLSLPKAQPATLVNLFKSWDLPANEAERLADALLDWTRADYVPTTGFDNSYDMDRLAFGSPARPMRSFSELRAIDVARERFFDRDSGRPNALHQQFVDSISLLEFERTNVNSAREGLAAALGLDASQAVQLQDYLAGRSRFAGKGPGFFRDLAELGTKLGIAGVEGLGTDILALRVNLRVREGRSSYLLRVLIAPQKGAARFPVAKAEPKQRDGTVKAPKAAPQKPAARKAARDDAEGALNYPFTILEIRENDPVPAGGPPPPPQA